MSISLHDASVLNYLQTLAAVSGFLEKGLAYCQEQGLDPEEIVETRLHPDMLPFRFQIQSVAYHSIGAIEGIKSGVFRPPSDSPPHDYAALQVLITEASDALKLLSVEEINTCEGGDVIFEFRDVKMPFTAESFVLSFSLPNFHFHAATAYDILRGKGVPLGKRDYIGSLRLKT